MKLIRAQSRTPDWRPTHQPGFLPFHNGLSRAPQFIHPGSVPQTMDDAIHRMNPFFVDGAICFVSTVIKISNNRLFH